MFRLYRKRAFRVIFYIIYTVLESIFRSCSIQYHVITNWVITRLWCIRYRKLIYPNAWKGMKNGYTWRFQSIDTDWITTLLVGNSIWTRVMNLLHVLHLVFTLWRKKNSFNKMFLCKKKMLFFFSPEFTMVLWSSEFKIEHRQQYNTSHSCNTLQPTPHLREES